MSKFECKNCGFTVEQEVQPESCPLCGEHDFSVSGGTQAGTVSVAGGSAREAAPTPAPAASKNSYAQFREFPTVQRERVKKDLEDKLEALRTDAEAYIGKQEATKKEKDLNSATMFFVIFMIGFMGTGCVTCVNCVGGNYDGFWDFALTFVIGIIISLVLAGIVGHFGASRKKYESRVEEKKSTAEEDKRKYQEEARRSISEYAESFDRAVKDTVQWFASNKTTEEIGNRILGSFVEAIERAPRDANRKDISVACQYSVYTSQVQYGGGIFSFSQNHCSSLAGPVEQAALAQAIAAYLEIRVLEKYEKDACGSVPQIVIGMADDGAVRTVTVTYKAANVNYRGI